MLSNAVNFSSVMNNCQLFTTEKIRQVFSEGMNAYKKISVYIALPEPFRGELLITVFSRASHNGALYKSSFLFLLQMHDLTHCSQTPSYLSGIVVAAAAAVISRSRLRFGSWICIAHHYEKLASEGLRYGSHSCYT